ncbi:MAG TPA: DUF3473 domain-containing protein [Candidatus Polarisedimenticolia bacterium]|nr:DUF3473 domain-containing protein [Candidatus Polarisedimenticolia bacterium]
MALFPSHTPDAATVRRHVLTVNLEDYYHLSPFKGRISRRDWVRFERRLEIGTRRTLAMLDEYDVRATFFTLGWVADQVPELVREVADRGHEVASKGYDHRSVRQTSPQEFREDLARAREAIERATGRTVYGYRVAERWLAERELWVLDLLAEEGYRYDSSVNPVLSAYSKQPGRRVVHQHQAPAGSIWEFPISGLRWLGLHLPTGGGNYFRQLPRGLMRRAVEHWIRASSAPFVMYFHTWELDPDQPRLAASLLSTIRQYRNLDRMEAVVRDYLARYPFQSVSSYLDLDVRAAGTACPRAGSATLVPAKERTNLESREGNPQKIAVVVPCFNEVATLPYLANTISELRHEFAPDLTLEWVIVDDGSRDQTWAVVNRLFAGRPDVTLIRHHRNRGVGPAIMTGLRRASSEVVCSIDCDCTYDPRELRAMISLLEGDVDLVTASPYHPRGQVRNIPAWRLGLSRAASALYRLVLGSKLSTYTSCFRVYRRSSIVGLDVSEGGFLGIAQLIGKLELRGGRIVEYPTTLNVRLLGQSKMKVARTILGHLRLLVTLGLQRLAGRRTAAAPALGSVVTPGEGEAA